MSAHVAIAVVSWNTRDLLDACLKSMAPEVAAGRAEVWVVDNGSIDGSIDLVSERYPWAHLSVPGQNLGFGPAVNRVADATKTPWIAAANADVALTPEALEELWTAGERHPRAGALAPRLLLPDNSTQMSVQPFPTLRRAVLAAIGAHRVSRRVAAQMYLPGHWDPARSAAVPWATGAFLMLRRNAFEAVGGFDEHQWLYAEDLDLCWRLRQAGWSIRHEARAVVRHEGSAASQQAFGAEGVIDTSVRAMYSWQARRMGLASAWGSALVATLDAGVRSGLIQMLASRDPTRWGPRLTRAQRDLRAARLGLRRPSALRAEPRIP